MSEDNLDMCEVMDATYDILKDEDRWGQGEFVAEEHDGHLRYCLVGGLYAGYCQTQGDTFDPGMEAHGGMLEAERLFMRWWTENTEATFARSVTDFNDADDREHGEVVAVLEHARAHFCKKDDDG